MPTPRTELAVAEQDGKIYVAGGYGGLTAFEAYDVATDTWMVLADLPVGREHPSLAALRGEIYLTGGSGVETWAYDPGTDTWSEHAPLLFARHAAAAVTHGEALYVVGGTGPNPTALQKYDPTLDTWTELAPLGIVRDHVAAVALLGKIYALGGRAGVGSVYNSTEVYDVATDTWSEGTPLLEGRSGFGAAVVGDRIYVAGGEVLVPPFSVRTTAEALDPVANRWGLVAPLPMPLHGIGAVGYAGLVWIFGGVSNPASASPRGGLLHVYEPEG
jgi:N-acetylneuraminic acid mutarotase